MLAEEGAQLVANDFDDLLIRRELHHYFGADGFGADVSEEFVGYADVDVAFEQGVANLGEGSVEVFVGELALAAEIFEGALKLFCKVFKHGFWSAGILPALTFTRRRKCTQAGVPVLRK